MSFVRIGTFQVKPDQIDILISTFERAVQPAMRGAEGNLAAYLLRQHGSTTFLACTIWRNSDDATRYEQSGAAAENVGKLRPTFAGPPALTTYDGYGG